MQELSAPFAPDNQNALPLNLSQARVFQKAFAVEGRRHELDPDAIGFENIPGGVPDCSNAGTLRQGGDPCRLVERPTHGIGADKDHPVPTPGIQKVRAGRPELWRFDRQKGRHDDFGARLVK